MSTVCNGHRDRELDRIIADNVKVIGFLMEKLGRLLDNDLSLECVTMICEMKVMLNKLAEQFIQQSVVQDRDTIMAIVAVTSEYKIAIGEI